MRHDPSVYGLPICLTSNQEWHRPKRAQVIFIHVSASLELSALVFYYVRSEFTTNCCLCIQKLETVRRILSTKMKSGDRSSG